MSSQCIKLDLQRELDNIAQYDFTMHIIKAVSHADDYSTVVSVERSVSRKRIVLFCIFFAVES